MVEIAEPITRARPSRPGGTTALPSRQFAEPARNVRKVDVQKLLRWYHGVRRPLPWRFTRDPYALLVSEVMLQQTQALRVVPYYERWLARFPDAATLATAAPRD